MRIGSLRRIACTISRHARTAGGRPTGTTLRAGSAEQALPCQCPVAPGDGPAASGRATRYAMPVVPAWGATCPGRWHPAHTLAHARGTHAHVCTCTRAQVRVRVRACVGIYQPPGPPAPVTPGPPARAPAGPLGMSLAASTVLIAVVRQRPRAAGPTALWAASFQARLLKAGSSKLLDSIRPKSARDSRRHCKRADPAESERGHRAVSAALLRTGGLHLIRRPDLSAYPRFFFFFFRPKSSYSSSSES